MSCLHDFTTLTQSDKLVELGISPKTANMRFHPRRDLGGRLLGWQPLLGNSPMDGCKPCWSSGALIALFPKSSFEDNKVWIRPQENGYVVRYDDYLAIIRDDLVEALVDMVEWCVNEGHIKVYKPKQNSNKAKK